VKRAAQQATLSKTSPLTAKWRARNKKARNYIKTSLHIVARIHSSWRVDESRAVSK